MSAKYSMTDITFTDAAKATAYHTARANTAWGLAPPAAQDAAILRAADHLRAAYPLIITEDTAAALEEANNILALSALSGPLLSQTRAVTREKKSLDGVGEIEREYEEGSNPDPFPNITALLLRGGAITGTAGGIRMGRLVR